MAKESKRRDVNDYTVNVVSSTEDGGLVKLVFTNVNGDSDEMIVIDITKDTSKYIRRALKQAYELAWR
jgi:hypothetical protein